jgi:MFS family permease
MRSNEALAGIRFRDQAAGGEMSDAGRGSTERASRPDGAVDAAFRKVTLRLLPFLGVCYLAAYLDRVNVGFAKLQMATALGLSDTAYGLGAGIFFVGYFLFEVPSNLILHRIGAKVWLARIMITWGLISAAMASLGLWRDLLGPHGAEYAFYTLRLLLGVAEAGFFPGVLLYLTYWFPASRQGMALSLFVLAQPVAFIVGAPLSGLILDLCDGLGGFAGWQWMYVLEAAPALLLGAWLVVRLDNSVADARWLTADEKGLVASELGRDVPPDRTVHLRDLIKHRIVWMLAAAYFLLTIGAYGLNFWLPSIVKAAGAGSNLTVGLLTAGPYVVGAVAMLSFGARTTAPRVARIRSAALCLMSGIGLALSAAYAGNVPAMMAGVTLGVAGYLSATALFWCVPNQYLGGAAVAAGLAAINAVGNLGGFIGPYLVGALSDRFGGPAAGLLVLAGALATAALMLTAIGRAGGVGLPNPRTLAADRRS